LEDDSSPDETKDIAIDKEDATRIKSFIKKKQTSRFAHLENILISILLHMIKTFVS
jgi:hypothetical protein